MTVSLYLALDSWPDMRTRTIASAVARSPVARRRWRHDRGKAGAGIVGRILHEHRAGRRDAVDVPAQVRRRGHRSQPDDPVDRLQRLDPWHAALLGRRSHDGRGPL